MKPSHGRDSATTASWTEVRPFLRSSFAAGPPHREIKSTHLCSRPNLDRLRIKNQHDCWCPVPEMRSAIDRFLV
jgi:hypothetical protein